MYREYIYISIYSIFVRRRVANCKVHCALAYVLYKFASAPPGARLKAFVDCKVPPTCSALRKVGDGGTRCHMLYSTSLRVASPGVKQQKIFGLTLFLFILFIRTPLMQFETQASFNFEKREKSPM